MSDTHGFEDHYDAEVWLLDMRHRLTPYVTHDNQRFELLSLVQRESRRAGLNPELVLALIQIESRFAADAVSSAGAQGLMQVMPFWKKEIGRPADDLFDPATNLEYGCTILAFYLKQERGDMTKALARYNGSRHQTWYPERVLEAWTHHWWVSQ
ncbi:lytic transglycosylase domain-containing protein [Phytohalomonas tamaricis]|uniref:lytic transglycosylase domain-containing protein n=1 Tax=Phytohalomonas tamaricis TaxID=2081032 RepID=UPI0021D43371|nr:transglycosylase SLT domain-containing protein [Phytohalomonas tamaricis]